MEMYPFGTQALDIFMFLSTSSTAINWLNNKFVYYDFSPSNGVLNAVTYFDILKMFSESLQESIKTLRVQTHFPEGHSLL